jgi:hypothetical protein
MFPLTSTNFVLSELTNEDGYFINDIIPQSARIDLIFDTTADFPSSNQVTNPQDVQNSPAFVLIAYREAESMGGFLVEDYYMVEDEPIVVKLAAADDGDGPLFLNEIRYSTEEKNILQNLYGAVEPTLQITLQNIAKAPENQRSIEFTEVSYDSLSSLEEASLEGFTVSTLTGSTTGLIITPEERISDVGGLSGPGRDRQISNTGVTTAAASTAISERVTTTGY